VLRSSTVGARIEEPKAVECGEGVSPPHWRGIWGGGCAPSIEKV